MPHSIGPLAYARGGAARLRSRWGRSLALAVGPLARARGGAARSRSRWGRSLTLAVGPLARLAVGRLAHARRGAARLRSRWGARSRSLPHFLLARSDQPHRPRRGRPHPIARRSGPTGREATSPTGQQGRPHPIAKRSTRARFSACCLPIWRFQPTLRASTSIWCTAF